MSAPLNLQLILTADARGLVAGVGEAQAAVGRLGAGAAAAGQAQASLERPIAATTGALDRQGKGARAAEEAQRSLARQTKLTAHETTNLVAQLNDMAVSLAGGMNPLMVLMQQGSQITPIFGGVRGTLSAVAAAATPARLALGGLAGAAIAGTAAWISYRGSIRDVEVALAGLGRNAGATQASLSAETARIAAPSGLSVPEVRALQVELLRTGRIGAESFGGIIALARDFAATIGTDVASAGRELAGLFADPAKGAETLHRQMGLIDGATARAVRRLAEQNREEEARLKLIEALPAALARAEQATYGLGTEWERLARTARNVFDWLGEATDRLTMGGLAAQEKIAADARREVTAPTGFARFIPRSTREEVAAEAVRRLQEMRPAARNFSDRFAGDPSRSRDALSTRALDVAGRYATLGDGRSRRDALDTELSAVRQGLTDPGLDASARERLVALERALAAARESLLSPTERLQALERVDLALLTARDPLTRARLTAERERIRLAGEVLDPAERSLAIDQAHARVLADAFAQAANRRADIEAETALRTALNGAIAAGTLPLTQLAAALGLEQQLRPLVAAAAAAEGPLRAQLTREIEAQRAAHEALATSQAQTRALSLGGRQNDELERLALEVRLIGATDAERRRAIATLEIEQRIRAEGLDKAPAEAAAYRERALAIADMTAALESQREALAGFASAWEGGIDSLMRNLAEGELALEDFRDVGVALLQDLAREWLMLAAGNPLKNLMLGTAYPTLASPGAAGAGLFGLFASPQAGAAAATSAARAPVAAAAPVAASAASTTASLATSLPAAGGALTFASSFRPGVDPRLVHILQETAARSPLPVQAVSGLRPGDPRFHGQGLAMDVALMGPGGVPLPNYQSAEYFRPYEQFAQQARLTQMQLYPELAQDFRWGGYFSGGPGTYGALDTMHFDLGGRSVPMGGGSWAAGLTPQQRSLWPGAHSVGMGNATPVDLTGLRSSLDGATTSVASFAASTEGAAGTMGQVAETASAAFGTGSKAVTTAFESASTDVAAGAGTFATGATGALGEAATTLGQGVSGLLGGIGNALSGLFSGIASAFSGGFGAVGSLFGFAAGGPVFSPGRSGAIRGAGTSTSDSIPALLPEGGFVLNAAATRRHAGLVAALVSDGETWIEPATAARHGALLRVLNDHGAPGLAALRLAAGGPVGRATMVGAAVSGGAAPAGPAGGDTYHFHYDLRGADAGSEVRFRAMLAESEQKTVRRTMKAIQTARRNNPGALS
jgi:phage-related minor tail protein